MSSKFTLCIPSKNRSGFLRRLLCYLAKQNFGHDILIGDSSNEDHFQRTVKEIGFLKGVLNIRHEKCWDMNTVQTVEHLCQWIITPYTGLICDDDFICVSGINQCIDFLDHHSEFEAARGIGFLISLDRNGPYGNIISILPYGPYSLISLEADSGAERLRDFFMKMPSIHNSVVYRAKIWKEMHVGYKTIQGSRPGFIFEELFASVISAIRNRIKTLDCLLIIRQAHDGIQRKLSFFEWVTDPEWLPAYQALRDKVIHELALQDQLDEKKAEQIFYEVFNQYICQFYQSMNHKPSAMTERLKASLKRGLRTLPGVKALNKKRKVQALRSQMTSPKHFLHPYWDSFKPILNTITHPYD